MAYDVQTEVFDGPFDLLLHLILNQQVELYEISLTQIIDAYLGELDRMEALDLDVATEFLLIAATLNAGTVLAIAGLGSHPRDADHMPLHVANTIFGGTFTAARIDRRMPA